MHEAVADQVGQRPAGQHGRAGHGQRAEAVDDAPGEVLGETSAVCVAPKATTLHEHARDEEVDVAAAGGRPAPPLMAPPKT